MKRLQRYILLLGLLLLAFGLAACGGDDADSDDSQATDTDNDTDSEISPTATLPPNATSVISIEDQYGGILTLTLPSGWVYDEGSGRIANSAEALAAEDYVDLTEGQMIVEAMTIPFESARMDELSLRSNSIPTIVLNAVKAEYDDAYSFGVARLNIMSGRQTGTMEGTYTAGETDFDVSISMFPVDDAFTLTVAHAPDGYIDGSVVGLIRTLMDSFEYTPGEPSAADSGEEVELTEEPATGEDIDADEAEPTEAPASDEDVEADMELTEEPATGQDMDATEEAEATEES